MCENPCAYVGSTTTGVKGVDFNDDGQKLLQNSGNGKCVVKLSSFRRSDESFQVRFFSFIPYIPMDVLGESMPFWWKMVVRCLQITRKNREKSNVIKEQNEGSQKNWTSKSLFSPSKTTFWPGDLVTFLEKNSGRPKRLNITTLVQKTVITRRFLRGGESPNLTPPPPWRGPKKDARGAKWEFLDAFPEASPPPWREKINPRGGKILHFCLKIAKIFALRANFTLKYRLFEQFSLQNMNFWGKN